jgi:hypothetical protein
LADDASEGARLQIAPGVDRHGYRWHGIAWKSQDMMAAGNPVDDESRLCHGKQSAKKVPAVKRSSEQTARDDE